MNKNFRLMIVSLIFCIVFVLGCSKDISSKLSNKIAKLKFEDIQSARIELAGTGGAGSINYTFDYNNSKHTEVLKDVIKCLNFDEIQGNADEKVTEKGGSPTYLVLELKDGSDIKIKSAIEGKIIKFSNGSTETSQIDIPDQITISTNSNEKSIKILSPQVRKLIDSGYKDVFQNIVSENRFK